MVALPSQLARTRRFTLGVPDQFTIAADGATVLFLRSRGGDDPRACLWALDTGSGTERLLADPAELPVAGAPPRPGAERRRAEPARAPGTGIGAYATDRSAALAAFTLAGELWTVNVADGRATRLPARGPVAAPQPDPAGRRIAYVSGGALRVIEADGSGDRALASPDAPEVAFGVSEHTVATSADGPHGCWWAPDGARLLVTRADKAALAVWRLSDLSEPAAPPRTMRYAAAGAASAEVTLWLAGLDGTRTEARWDRDAFEYLVGAGWDAHGPCAVVQTRSQRTVRFLRIDPASGQTAVLSEQQDACWVQLIPGLPARSASGAVLSHADLAGTRHLTADGVTVTPPGLQLRAVLGVDGRRGAVHRFQRAHADAPVDLPAGCGLPPAERRAGRALRRSPRRDPGPRRPGRRSSGQPDRGAERGQAGRPDHVTGGTTCPAGARDAARSRPALAARHAALSFLAPARRRAAARAR